MDITLQEKTKRKRKLTPGEWFEEYGSTLLFIVPTFIMFLLLTVYPILWVYKYMFYDYDGITKATFTGFDNLVRAFTRDPDWWQSVLVTFKIAFLKLIIEIPLATLTAVIINEPRIKGKGLFRGVYFLPTVTSAAVMSVVFSFIFSPYNGILNSILMNLGIINSSIDFLGNPTSALVCCTVISVWQIFGQNTLLILSALQGISQDVYESAEIDGAGRFKCFLHISVPLMMPTFRIILMLAIIGSLGVFDSVYVLTAGGPQGATTTMAVAMYMRLFGEGIPEYGYTAALSAIYSVISGLLTIIYLTISKKTSEIY
ncbi:MAG: sugar ABC transporter permease [Clostridia bacterium]|nr:sugar ABC transporter permease [Clostridia bacterium]